jgi:hypothetical protein
MLYIDKDGNTINSPSQLHEDELAINGLKPISEEELAIMFPRSKAKIAEDARRATAKTVTDGMPYNNSVFQIDATSRTNIYGKAIYLLVNPSVSSVTWKALNNDKITFTRAEFFVFASAVSDYYENLILTT